MAGILDPNDTESYLKHSDEEKSPVANESASMPSTATSDIAAGDVDIIAIPDTYVTNRWQRFANKVEKLTGAEARGIEQVDESLRQGKTSLRQYWDMCQIWFSVNLTANILTIGVLGPIAFGLGPTDAFLCCLFGTIAGSAITCYIATLGPISGLRTMAAARFTMGWWPGKLCIILNEVIILGYGLVDTIICGQVLSAVSGGTMSVIVGIVVMGILIWVVSVAGIKYVHYFEKYAFFPQVCVLFVLIGVAAPHFDMSAANQSTGTALIGGRISYFFLCASGPMGWGPNVQDYFPYHPISTNRWGTWAMTLLGFVASKIFVEFIGIGLGVSLAANPTWAAAFSGNDVGALLNEVYSPLGAFGRFCTVIIGLGIAANIIPGSYSAAFGAQLLSTRLGRVPRIFWTTLVTLVYTVCAIGGREQLLPIFLNFLPLIGYWVLMWIVMTMQEEFMFRRTTRLTFTADGKGIGYEWSRWNEREYLPLGIAALATFLTGWVWAILCMSQTYFTGPIAALIPADLGLPVSATWAALVYPILRRWELSKFGR
ncbi:hypothetical protein B0H66DRAFT_619333 [Apodospora peruviana]|uniref:Uncharacterized protein n=1 Tax=Apodospora peruviana TaxID=516989 RepID=A0AAE0IBE3_9PEZI|nr:hypothetical protein B0H66DRAFT_619333 [Apodospora peruviana]